VVQIPDVPDSAPRMHACMHANHMFNQDALFEHLEGLDHPWCSTVIERLYAWRCTSRVVNCRMAVRYARDLLRLLLLCCLSHVEVFRQLSVQQCLKVFDLK
jgi:hypothetical protein